MPLTSGFASRMTVGAKTWRPKPADQIMLEAEQKRAAEMEELKLKGIEKKMETLENVRKLEEKTQRFNELAATAELRAQAAESELRERAALESKRRELTRLELAKRAGHQNLDEAEIERIRRDRMKAELLARAADSHVHQRPLLSSLDLAAVPTHRQALPPISHPLPLPPPPPRPVVSPAPLRPMANPIPPQRMPMPMPTRSTPMNSMPPQRMPAVSPLPSRPLHMPMSPHGHGLAPLPPPPAQPILRTLPPPVSRHHQRVPSEPGVRLGRLAGGLGGLGRGAGGWGLPNGALRGAPPHATAGVRGRGGRLPMRGGMAPRGRRIPPGAGRHFYRDLLAQRALRLQAERLRRRKLENLDLKARQNALRAQALREMRQRELAADLRERGLQQREIEAQVRMMGERERALNEAQLRDLRDREHRLQLKERGLQEREILEQMRRRDELEREALRLETERLERDLRVEELAEAERAIRRAYERNETPPMGISRPSVAEMRAEGYLDDEFMEGFHNLESAARDEILHEDGLALGDAELLTRTPRMMRPRTPMGHRSAASVGGRTPLMRDDAALGSMTPRAREREEFLLREDALAREEMLRQDMMREDMMQEEMLRDDLRRESEGRREDARLREQEHLLREQDQMAREQDQMMREQNQMLREQQEHALREQDHLRPGGRGGYDGLITPRMREAELAAMTPRMREAEMATMTPRMRESELLRAARTPSVVDNLEYSRDMDRAFDRGPGAGLGRGVDRSFDREREREELGLLRPASRGSMRSDAIHRPSSRASLRDAYERREPLALPMAGRPASRAGSRTGGLSAEELGLGHGAFGNERERERERVQLDALRNEAGLGGGHRASTTDDLLAQRLQSAALNKEVNGRSRANSVGRGGEFDDDLRRAELESEIGGYGANSLGAGPRGGAARSRAASLNRGAGRYGGGGGGGLAGAADDFAEIQAQEAALRDREARHKAELASEYGGFGAGRKGGLGRSGSHGALASLAREGAERYLDQELDKHGRGAAAHERGLTRSGSHSALSALAREGADRYLEHELAQRGERPGLDGGLGRAGERKLLEHSQAGDGFGGLGNLAREAGRDLLDREGGLAGVARGIREEGLGGFARQAGRDILNGGGRGTQSRPLSADRRGASIERPASRIERELYEHEGGSVAGGSLAGMSEDEFSRLTDAELAAYVASEQGAHRLDDRGLHERGLDPHDDLDHGGVTISRPRHGTGARGSGYGESPPFGSGHAGAGGLGAGLLGVGAGAAAGGAGANRYAHSAPGSPRGRFDRGYDPYGAEGADPYGAAPEGYDHDPYGYDDGYGSYGPDELGRMPGGLQEEDYGENDFVITESDHPEQEGVRIVESLGMVEAQSEPSHGMAGDEPDGMHSAVSNLITEASRRGANGVVSLRVSDGPRGVYIASGEAVVLS